jgi:hypothetical protein
LMAFSARPGRRSRAMRLHWLPHVLWPSTWGGRAWVSQVGTARAVIEGQCVADNGDGKAQRFRMHRQTQGNPGLQGVSVLGCCRAGRGWQLPTSSRSSSSVQGSLLMLGSRWLFQRWGCDRRSGQRTRRL